MIDLTRFREAGAVYWTQHTVFTPGHGVDGTLYADGDPDGQPLDTYTTESLPRASWTWGATQEGGLVTLPSGVRVFPGTWSETVIGLICDAGTIAGLRDTVRAWARDVLGRDDIVFVTRDAAGQWVPDAGDEREAVR